jgi:hypothetical protein
MNNTPIRWSARNQVVELSTEQMGVMFFKGSVLIARGEDLE